MDKHKIKNIALGVSLGLNILLGFFLGGGLISSCTAKKAVNPASSVSVDAIGEIIDGTQKRALKPRLAADDDFDPNDYTNLWTYDLPTYTFSSGANIINWDSTQQVVQLAGNGRIHFNQITRAGLYWFSFKHSGSDWGDAYVVNRANYETIMTSTTDNTFFQCVTRLTASGGYFYLPESAFSGTRLYVAVGQQFYQDALVDLFLIDGGEIPPKVTLDLGADWSPVAWLSNRASENYALLTTSFDNPQNTQFRLGFDGLIFSTLNDERYFDAVRVLYRPLWTGARYTYGGETLSYTYDNNAEFRLALVTGVEFRDLNTKNWFNVANSRLNMLNPSSPVFTALLDWVSPQYRTLRFWAYPLDNLLAPSIQEVTYNAGVSWANYGRAPVRYGLDFFGWLGLDPYGYVETNAGIGDAFSLLNGAFTAVGGILNIQILPFLTLGTLIFVPLVVLIILAILRLLAK